MRWEWTAQDCLTQLHILGVWLSVSDHGNLVVDAPADLELTIAMLTVIKKYKPGLMQILGEHRNALVNPGHVESTR